MVIRIVPMEPTRSQISAKTSPAGRTNFNAETATALQVIFIVTGKAIAQMTIATKRIVVCFFIIF
jgi:hypothetical protein